MHAIREICRPYVPWLEAGASRTLARNASTASKHSDASDPIDWLMQGVVAQSFAATKAAKPIKSHKAICQENILRNLNVIVQENFSGRLASMS